MRSNTLILLCFLPVMLLTVACGGGPTNTNSSGSNNSGPGNGNSGSDTLTPRTPTPEQTTNNAPTLTPVYKAFCQAMEKKDEAGLRKVFSSDTVKFVENEIKTQGLKPPTLVKYFEDEQVTSDLCEVRNEVITGDSAVAEVRTKSIPNWGTRIIFVKENGEWKVTNKFPTAVTKTSGNPTTGNTAEKK
ncbi:MAG: nuclear transport factor 2 family protein [Acidobacteria bacterium]|nr:nuclear transport factor 2 family protein [Acidobacteriota bacterium]